MSDAKYVSSKAARDTLGVCNKTLRSWATSGKLDFILTDGGWRRYNVSKYLKQNDLLERKKICYCRVSSYDQKNDLATQVSYLMKKYPDYEIIKDIGSGINFKRKGLRKLIELAINNELSEVVVTFKDRLCRIGYELIQFIFEKYSNAKIIIENDKYKLPQEEITEDLIEIITVYSSKLYGSRSNKKKDDLLDKV
jgi:predicted site-specific integrase-resolvase